MSDAQLPSAPPLHVQQLPPADVRKGALLALLTVPAGVLVWVVVWSMGFIASLVGALVAFGALRLYLWGAGRITRAGAAVVLTITTATLLLAFFAGIVLDGARGIGEVSGLGAWAAFTHPEFWPTFSALLPEALPEYLPDFAFALGFGALGSFSTLRGAFAASNEVVLAPAAQAPWQGQAPAPGQTPAPGYAPAAPPVEEPPAHEAQQAPQA